MVNRPDYVEVVVSNLPSPYMESRLEAMRQIKDLAINIDFLKFTVDGMSFVVKNSDWPKFEEEPLNKLSLRAGHNRSVLLVYAVNMRDEEGLVARIVSLVIAAGVEIFHMGDMHDRLLMVIDSAKAELAVSALQEVYPEVTVSDSV